jgi:phosphoglycolate phosphatase
MAGLPFILFDMDGTLLDTRLDIARAANCARAELGLPSMSVDEVVAAVGDGVNLFVSRVTYPEADPRFADARKVFLKHYALNVIGDTHPYAGVFETLEWLFESGYPMAVVSNKPVELVDTLVKHFRWQKYFRCWLGGDSAARPKPAVDPLKLAVELSGFPQETRLLMVGDGLQDVWAAKAIKCEAAWCAWGFVAEQPQGYPSHRLERPQDLIDLLSSRVSTIFP